jgi:DNA polymerase III, alpha subunit (gram-positive type)
MISDKQEALWVAGLLATNRYRLLRRVDLRNLVFPEPEGDVKSAVFVDVETTGLSHGHDKVIELGMQAFDFDAKDRIVGLGPSYTGVSGSRHANPIKDHRNHWHH